MEEQKNFQISIPKPCHEDWNKMTPNEKGAFCGKCAKTVVDFTKKTTDEIRDFLLSQSGKKTCGRFMSDQLDTKPKTIDIFIPLHLLPKKLSFNKAFIFSLFIAFGTSLFSCSTQQGEVVGKISPADTSTSLQGSSTGTRISLGDTTYIAPEKGNVKTVNTNCMMKGDVDIQPLQGEVSMPADTAKTTKDSLLNEFKTGKIKMEHSE